MTICEYGFICMKQFYYLAKIVVKNCRCQFEVLANSVLKVSVLSPVAMLVAEKGRNKLCCYSARRLEHPFPTPNFLCAVHWYVIPLPFPAVFFFPLSLVSCYFQHARKKENNKPLHAGRKVCWDEGKQELGLKGLLFNISHWLAPPTLFHIFPWSCTLSTYRYRD